MSLSLSMVSVSVRVALSVSMSWEWPWEWPWEWVWKLRHNLQGISHTVTCRIIIPMWLQPSLQRQYPSAFNACSSLCSSSLSFSMALSLEATICFFGRSQTFGKRHVKTVVSVYQWEGTSAVQDSLQDFFLSDQRRCTEGKEKTRSQIVHLNTSYRKAHALPPSCPNYYADLLRAPLHKVLPKPSPPLHVLEFHTHMMSMGPGNLFIIKLML
jgi:hypothetical protein